MRFGPCLPFCWLSERKVFFQKWSKNPTKTDLQPGRMRRPIFTDEVAKPGEVGFQIGIFSQIFQKRAQHSTDSGLDFRS